MYLSRNIRQKITRAGLWFIREVVVEGRLGEFGEELADAFTDEVDVAGAGFCRGARGVSACAVVVELSEVPAGLDPFLLQGFEAKGAGFSVASDVGLYEVGVECHRYGCFELSCVVIGLGEDFVVVVEAYLPPVAEEDEDVHFGLYLADERFEFVSAVAVYYDDFSDSVFSKRDNDIADDCVECSLCDVYGERVCEKIAIDAVGYGGKTYHGLAFIPGQLGASACDVRGVEEVLSLREVAVVCLDGAYGQDGDLVFSL